MGDDWIRAAAQYTRRMGFETVLDEKPETFSASYPMSQIAFYAGWYDGQVSGPFTRPVVEFMPGAIAYHLYSFSASAIRTPNQFWVGPLLAKGATATMGSVAEPYLDGTPDLESFFGRILFFGFSFGEAAYASQAWLSWQTTVIGDPLYHPFKKSPPLLHEELRHRKSKLLEWSYARVVGLNLATGVAPQKLIDYLEAEPLTKESAVLQEKLGDLYYSRGKIADAIDSYIPALALNPTPQQRVRVTLGVARLLTTFHRDEEALELYRQFLRTFPDYPDLLTVYQLALALAKDHGKEGEAAQYQKEIESRSPTQKP